MTMIAAEADLLARAAPYLRRPASHEGELEIRDGILDLMGEGPARRGAQLSLDHASLAWFYDRFRHGLIARVAGIPDFASECQRFQKELDLQPRDVVLDLACGHGNFTVALAERVGPGGLVIGVDISRAMLRRAVSRVRRARLENVLLVWGDAHDLPIADRSLAKLNCAGGFHSLPDLPKALAELARVSVPGARLNALSFAAGEDDRHAKLKQWLHNRFGAHFVPLDLLRRELEDVGFEEYRAYMNGSWVGYASARMRSGS